MNTPANERAPAGTPQLCAASSAGTVGAVRRDHHRAMAAGADLLEIRLDLLPPGELEKLQREAKWLRERGERIVLTFRAPEQGGRGHTDTATRLRWLITLADLIRPRCIDVELTSLEQCPDVSSLLDVLIKAQGRGPRAEGRGALSTRLILSEHHLAGRPSNPAARLAALKSSHLGLTVLGESLPGQERFPPTPVEPESANARLAGTLAPPQDPRLAGTLASPEATPSGLPHATSAHPEVLKLVWHAADARDNITALDLQRQAAGAGLASTVFCMGTDGLCSRVLGRKFGAALTYAALATGEETAPGQPAIDELLGRYRWRGIDDRTAVYGVIGDPVAHSLSPAVHNAAFAAVGLNAVYVPLRVPAAGGGFESFIDAVRARPWLGFGGCSVTAPHKEAAFRTVQQQLDPAARRLGAINTLSFQPAAGNEEHRADRPARGEALCPAPLEPPLHGDNTDAPAALTWLQRGLDCNLEELASRRFAVLGAGGLARTLAAVLTGLGARVTICSRTAATAAALARELACDSAKLETPIESDVIINCTPAGTWPDVGGLPVDPRRLPAGAVVFDAVYNPQQTRFLREASQRGCRTIGGLDLFIEQAALQFTRWTGRAAPREVMRAAALQTLLDAT